MVSNHDLAGETPSRFDPQRQSSYQQFLDPDGFQHTRPLFHRSLLFQNGSIFNLLNTRQYSIFLVFCQWQWLNLAINCANIGVFAGGYLTIIGFNV